MENLITKKLGVGWSIKDVLDQWMKSMVFDFLCEHAPEYAEDFRTKVIRKRIDLLNSRGYRGMQDFEKGKQ